MLTKERPSAYCQQWQRVRVTSLGRGRCAFSERPYKAALYSQCGQTITGIDGDVSYMPISIQEDIFLLRPRWKWSCQNGRPLHARRSQTKSFYLISNALSNLILLHNFWILIKKSTAFFFFFLFFFTGFNWNLFMKNLNIVQREQSSRQKYVAS